MTEGPKPKQTRPETTDDGIVAGAVVLLDASAKLPAADGSQLTNNSPGPAASFVIGGAIDTLTLPFVDLASEVVKASGTLVTLRGQRGTPGSAGTTTIQLYKNGVAVAGATLSWATTDAAWTAKSVTLSPALSVVAGDRLSLALTSAETGGDDIIAEVNN